MTERMVEALEIEGKLHEVHWYDDEGHGWERRENRRDAFERIARVPADARPRRTVRSLTRPATNQNGRPEGRPSGLPAGGPRRADRD